MKKKQKKEISNVEESPQQSLERIIKAEIDVAQNITAAKEQAEKRIDSAQDEVVQIKKIILEQARFERESLLTAGLESAKKTAQEKIDTVRKKTERYTEIGSAFVDKAVKEIIDIVLHDNEGGIL